MADSELRPSRRFEPFEVDFRAHELRKHGIRLRLSGQPFEILALLLSHPGEVVTREELRAKLWPADTFVDFDHGLNAAINKLREALGDSAEKPRFVETLPRRGYRFIAPVQKPPEAAAASTPAAAPEASVWRRPALGAVLAAVLVVVAGFGLYFYHARVGRRAAASHTTIRSVAVLPLENLSRDTEQDYFAEGMTDELITSLAKIPELQVISRTSIIRYKGTRKPLPEIAGELGVDALVEGGVWRSGERIRITAQLVDGRSDRHLWAETYERDLRDALAIQNDVARDIARQISTSLALIAMNYDWDWAEAERQYRLAIQLNPNYATAHHWYAEYLVLVGRFPEGLAQIKRAQELDPFSVIIQTDAGKLFCMARQYDGAVEQLRKAIEMDANFALAQEWLGVAQLEKGRFAEASAAIQSARHADHSVVPAALLGYTYAAMRRSAEARRVLEESERQAKAKKLGLSWLACAYAELGEKDQAFALLEEEYRAHGTGMTSLKVNPLYDPLRSDPRFQDLVRRVGLPP